MKEATNTNTAVVVWNAEVEQAVRDTINSGASVPKAVAACAPKGFISGLRTARATALSKESGKILGQLQQNGFRLSALSAIKTLKSGVQRVSVTLSTPKPTSNMTIAEYAAANGKTVEQMLAALK